MKALKFLPVLLLCLNPFRLFGQEKFEGVLCYSWLKSSPVLSSASIPVADTVFYYVKGDKIHSYMKEMGLHNICYMDNGVFREIIYSDWCDLAVDIPAADKEIPLDVKTVDLMKKRIVQDMECSMYKSITYMGKSEIATDVYLCKNIIMPEVFGRIIAGSVMGKDADNSLLVRSRTAIIYDKKGLNLFNPKCNGYMDLLSKDICEVTDEMMTSPARCQLERIETLPTGKIEDVGGIKINFIRLGAWSSAVNKIMSAAKQNMPSVNNSKNVYYKYEGSWIY